MTLRTGHDAPPERIIAFLEANGYNRAGTVMEPGEYATRGGIIDLFPAGEPEPVRVDLFGDTVESLRQFDPSTQRSTGKRDALILRPVSEVPLDPSSVTRFRESWRDLFGPGAATDPLYQSISEGRRYPGIEHWTPLFHDTMETLLDYLHLNRRGASVLSGDQRSPASCARRARRCIDSTLSASSCRYGLATDTYRRSTFAAS